MATLKSARAQGVSTVARTGSRDAVHRRHPGLCARCVPGRARVRGPFFVRSAGGPDKEWLVQASGDKTAPVYYIVFAATVGVIGLSLYRRPNVPAATPVAQPAQ